MSHGCLCIFGEVLFDHFPDGQRVLGGAPFNVAWHLQAFGQAPHLISRVGKDDEGEAVRSAMHDWGMDTSGLQTDAQRPTGRVNIRFVEGGEPEYDIVEQCAYDAIEAAPETLPDCRLLYHGSLALREPASLQVVQRLKRCAPETVFVDVNLRPPWWDKQVVLEMLRGAHWVKLNTDELALLHAMTGGSVPPAGEFLADHGLTALVLTHGVRGAELLTDSGEHLHVSPAGDTEVVDTVGAGDAFASVMILGLARDWPLGLTLQRAQDFASLLVGQRGATVRDPAFYQPLIQAWKLDAH